MPHKPEGSL